MSEINKKVGFAIKIERMRAGITQEALGRHLGKSRVTVTTLEQGKQGVTLEILYKVAALFEKPISHFLPEVKKIPDKSRLPRALEKEIRKLPGVNQARARRILLRIISNNKI